MAPGSQKRTLYCAFAFLLATMLLLPLMPQTHAQECEDWTAKDNAYYDQLDRTRSFGGTPFTITPAGEKIRHARGEKWFAVCADTLQQLVSKLAFGQECQRRRLLPAYSVEKLRREGGTGRRWLAVADDFEGVPPSQTGMGSGIGISLAIFRRF